MEKENKDIANYFEELNKINVSGKVEKKNGLSYLSWTWAWEELKKKHPNANYTIYERETPNGLVNYFTDGKTCWVKTGVTINDIEHIEYLPVMDYKNKSVSLEAITSTDVNKTIQRSLTKAIARHGLGLYVYAGEDLPADIKEVELQKTKLRTSIIALAKELGGQQDEVVMKLCNEIIKSVNPNSCDDLDALEKLEEALSTEKVNRTKTSSEAKKGGK